MTRAQVWLRRARQAAPDAASADAIARDYRTLRQRNPLALSLDFGIAPSTNINNGSSSGTFEFLGLDFLLSPEAQALSGFEVAVGAGVTYRLRETARSRTTAGVSAQVKRHALETSAQEAAPDFDAASLNQDQLSLSLTHQWATPSGNQPASVSLSYGVTWLDGADYAREVTLGASRRWKVDDQSSVEASLSYGLTRYVASEVEADHWDATLQWARALENGHGLALTLGAGQSLSESDVLAHDRASIGVRYDMGRVAEGLDVSLGLSHGWRDYRPTFLVPDGRSEQRTEATLTVGLPDLELYGFNPVITLMAQDTASNSSRYESQTLTLDIGFRSSF